MPVRARLSGENPSFRKSRHSDIQVATEGAARSNIAHALSKISKLDL